MSFRVMIVIGVAFGLMSPAGCSNGGPPPGNDNDNVNDNANSVILERGQIAGQLIVLARQDRITLLEEEPNDTLDEVGTAAIVEAGTRLEIFGNLSTSNGDVSDSYFFEVGQPLLVEAVLSFEFNPDDPTDIDMGMGIADFESTNCTQGVDNQTFSQCFDTEKNPETASFEVNGDFGLVIQAIAGDSDYLLGLEFSEPDGSAASARPIKHVAEVRMPASNFIPGQAVVKFDQNLSETSCRKILDAYEMEIMERSPSGFYLLRHRGKAAQQAKTRRTIKSLRAHKGVRVAEPNFRYYPAEEPNDEYFDMQWHYDLINLADAWDVTTGSDEVIAAVVDTGILPGHPEVQGRLTAGFDFISDPDSARDQDGLDDDPTDEGDLSGGPGQSSYHGTHVAGTIGAATNNGDGVAGVTWTCRIMPVRALGLGGGSSFDIAEAIRYAAQIENVSGELPAQPADVINLSIASPAGSPASVDMESAINEAVAKGIAVVAAAGNDALSLPAYPAAFENVISVSACDPQLEFAPYSNFGSTIDISAPGGNLALDLTGDGWGDGVLSLGASITDDVLNYELSFQHGTSMASPHVAGVIALMKSVNSGLGPSDIRDILTSTAIDAGDAGDDDLFGAGVVNAALAVSEAAARAGEPGLDAPKLSLSTHALSFGGSIDELTVRVSNTGGDILQVTGVTAKEKFGSEWLEATTESSSDMTTNISDITVRIARQGLAEGSYFGTVFVSAEDQETQNIEVTMTVGQEDTIEDIIFVVAIDAETRASVAQDETTADEGFQYRIELPAGTYKVYAGTDRDNDDLICDLGELCGALPSAIDANEITVETDQITEEVDFAVGELIFQSQSFPIIMGLNIKRLDQAGILPIQSSRE